MTKEKIVSLLQDENQQDVEKFASYIMKLCLGGKNPWIQNREEKQMAELYKRVSNEGLVFDGVHITLQSIGISYDYIAYKNKMFLAYPDSRVDVSLVYKDDTFIVAKESGSIIYTHNIKEPFNTKEADIIGGYCVIRNKRGEFITLLSKEDIDKHRKVAKTDFIWRQWFNEMALKTVIKKACKQHFADVYNKIEEMDNDNYNLENPLELDLKYKQEIDAIGNIKSLKEYYQKNKGQGKEFDKYISIRKEQLKNV